MNPIMTGRPKAKTTIEPRGRRSRTPREYVIRVVIDLSTIDAQQPVRAYVICAMGGSLYRMSSTNSVGQAPSVHCGVCGGVLIEWGSSKVWSAELVHRADSAK